MDYICNVLDAFHNSSCSTFVSKFNQNNKSWKISMTK